MPIPEDGEQTSGRFLLRSFPGYGAGLGTFPRCGGNSRNSDRELARNGARRARHAGTGRVTAKARYSSLGLAGRCDGSGEGGTRQLVQLEDRNGAEADGHREYPECRRECPDLKERLSRGNGMYRDLHDGGNETTASSRSQPDPRPAKTPGSEFLGADYPRDTVASDTRLRRCHGSMRDNRAFSKVLVNKSDQSVDHDHSPDRDRIRSFTETERDRAGCTEQPMSGLLNCSGEVTPGRTVWVTLEFD